MATEAVSIQEPISMVEKMATEAVIIQEPVSIVEKLAAEALIIAEPISLAKLEEESKNLTLEVSTNNNGVETENIVSEGNPEISKGESFLVSPEISMVANETTKMLEHIEVDGSAFKAEKIPEDEEKMVIRNEEKDGTQDVIRKDDINYGSEEIKERCSMDSHDPIVESLKDANETVSDAGNSDRVQEDTEPEKLPAEVGMDHIISDCIGDTLAKRVAESEGIACIHEPEVDEKLEEVSSEEIKCINGDVQDENLFHTSSVVETKASDIRTENAVEECPTEETGRSEMNENTDQDFGMSGELCKDYANSELENVVVDMIQVAYKEPAMTDSSDEMKRDEESAVAAPEGDIIEPDPEPVSILNEKHVSPINVVYEDVATTISAGTAETSASIEGATSSKDCEESSDGEGRGTMAVKENVEDEIRAEKFFETLASVTDKVDSLEKENEVCKESETEASGTGKENPETKEYPIAAISESNSSISDETVNESVKEGESSPMKLSEEASNSNVEETEKSDKDPSPFDVKESKEEIIPVELKEELVRSSSFEPEVSGKDTEEETNAIEDEALGEKDEITNDAIEEIGISTTEHEGIGVEGANIDVNSTVSTVTCEKKVEILEPREDDGMQVEILNAGSEDQMEMATTKEIPLKEVLGGEVKEHSTVPSEEYETIEERRLTETSEKDQDPFEHSEKVAADVIPNTDTESAVAKAVDDIKIHEESTVLIPEGSITEAGNTSLVGQSGEEILESFQQMNEPENEKPACPLNVVSEDVDTAETSATIEEATSIEDHEERSEGEVREDSPAHHLQIEVNENKKTVEVDITNQNADDLQAIVSSVAQPAENEQGMQFELPDVLSEERVHEAIGASKEKEEDSEDVSEVCKSSDSINPEHIFTEAAATTDSKPETSKMDNENLMFVEKVYLLDSEQCSESNEALENKEDRIQQELEECTAEKLELKDAVNIEDNSKHEETKEAVEKLESDNAVEIAEKRILEDEDTENQITLKEVSGSETAASCTKKEEIKPVEEELVHSSSLELEESKKDTEEETTVKECIETADLDCTSQAAKSEETNLKEVKAEAEAEEEKNEINNVIDCKDNVIGIETANTDVKSADSYVLSEKDIEISRQEDGMQDQIQNAGSEDQMEMTIEEIPLKEVLGEEMKEISTMPSEDYEGTLIEETIVIDGTLEEDQALHKHSEDVAVDVQPVENEALEHKEEGIMHELEDCSAENPEPKDAVENIEDSSKLEETNEVLEDPKSIIKEACGIIDDSLKSTEVMKEESKEENTAAMVSITETSNSIIDEKVSIEETAKSDNDPSLFDVAKESNEEITPIEVKEDHVHSSLFELDESRNFIEEEISEAEMEETNVKEAEAETEEKNEINDAAVVEENSVERTEHEEIGILSAEIEVKSVDSYITGEKDMEIPEEHFPKAESEDTGNEIGHEVEEQLAEESNVEVTNVSSGEEHGELENQTDACEAKTLQDETSSDLGREREKIEDGKPLDEAIDLEETSSTCKDDEKAIEEENLAKNLEKTESLKEDTEIENQEHMAEMVIMTDNANVGDYSSVSTECLKETESEEQIVAENLEVEEHSINDGEASHVTRAVEETRQDKESRDPITVHCEDREAEEKIEEIINDSKLCHDEGCIEAVTVVSAETSLNDTEKIVNVSNITPVETSLENIESDANQETEVENVQLAEISSELDLDVQTKDNDEVQKQNLNMKTVDKDEAEVIQRVPDAFYMLEVRVPEAEKGLIAETMDGQNRDHELVVMKNEASKNADELGKIDDIGSPNTVLGVKPEEQIQTSACTLLSDDYEIGTGNPVEKIEEEMQKDDEVCLSEQRELEAVSEEKTIADQVLLHDKPENTETASSTLPSEESEHGTRAISEEIEYRKTTEELPTELDVVTGDEVTGEQTLPDDKPEGTTSTLLVFEEDAEGNIHTDEKEEEEKIYEADMIPNKISEDISVVETTAESCLGEEELLELDDGKRDAAEKEDEKTNEAEIIGDENEEDALDAKKTLEICSKTERSIELEAVAEDEVAAGETLTEKISDEVQNPTSALPSKEEECESTITAEMIESGKTPDDNGEDEFFHKDCLREDEVLLVYESASSQVNPTEKPEGLPNPVDTLATDQLQLMTSMLSSEVQGDEMMGSELKEDESPEKIPEQTWEIEEAYDFNTEIHEKDLDNELQDGKENAALQEKLVKSGTETGEIIPNEVSTEKAIMEDKKASENENPIVDQTVEDPGQASAGRIETTAVTQENVELALAGLEEKPESDLEPVAEDRSKKTIAEHTESQDVETSIDIQYQETEEPIKEPKEKLEAEDNINGEESTNEVTKAAILSEVVDKEVDKVGIEDIKEQVMEEKSGTNELRPTSKGDEATDELEDYSGERIEEVKLEEQIDYIGSPNTVLEVKPEEHIQTLLSEDEQIGTANPVEKIEEEKQKDAEVVHDSREVSSETKTIEEACLSNEGQKELKAVSEEETSADQVPLNDEPEEQIQTTPSTLQFEESEHGTGARSEETEYGKTKEELPAKLGIVTGDEVTREQALSDNKPEESTTSTPLVSEEDGEESILTVEKTEEEKIYERDMIADKISEDLSVVETTAEVCLEKEELLELDDGKKDDAEKEDEKTNEAEIIIDEIEEDAKDSKTTLEICSQTERSVVLEAVAEDEMTAGETLAEKISDEVKSPTSALPLKEEESESTITAEMLEALAVDENASSPTEKHKDLLKPVDTLPTDHLHLTTSMLPSEVQGDERKETELKEDESPEKIAEQTMEIEEASGLNTEIHEKASDNELPDETEDAAIQEKLVKAATETTEIILNEVSTEKVIMESQKTSENENLSEDKSVDDLGQTSVAKIDTTAVTKENVELAPAGLEEKPESDLEPLSEDQSNETITEHDESQDDETNIDIRNQETEEQIKEELKDNPETDDSINEEENSNEVTEAVSLSEEVGKEVEKADCIEDIKEHVMEEESSTNELHPISKGDEANNEVGDYRAVSTERIEKVEFEEQIEAQNTEVEENSTEDKQGSHVTIELVEGRQEEEFGHPLMVCGEDREKEEIEGIIDDSKLRQDGTQIEAVTEERAETSLKEELVYTSNISSIKMNLETIENDANQETEVIQKVQLEEMSSNLAPQVRTNDNDEEEVIKRDPVAFYIAKDHIAEAESGPIAALEVDKVEETEGVPETSSHYTSERIETVLKDDISSTNTLPEEKLEQLQISARTLLSEDEEVQKDTEIKHEILEDSFDTKTIEEVCLPNEEQRELKAVTEEEIIADKGLPNDEPEEQIQTTSSALPSNEPDYRTGGMSEETTIKLDVVTGDEITGEQTLETTKPEEKTTSSPLVSMEEEEPESSFEKIEEEKLSEADIPDKNSEDFSDATKTAETCSEKQVFQELDDATEDETAAAQALQVQESHEKSLTSELPVENLKHGAEANEEEEEEEEEEKVKEVEMLKKEGPREPEAVVDPETILARASIAEESQEIETIVIVENLDEENIEGDTKDGTTLLTKKMNEESKEDNTAKMVSITEASNSIIEETVSIEETEKSSNDTIMFDIEKELKEEITPIEVKEDHVHSSSFELEESKNVTEEETSVAETEETNIKEAEKEEERNETNDDAVVVEENRVERTEHEDISVCSAENDVKSVDSYITPQQDMEIPKKEDAMQDKVPNARTGDQLEMSTKEIPLKETLGDEVEDHDAAHSEERKISDETSEKYQVPYEHSETPLSQATDEKLIQNDDNPQLDVPKAEPEDTGNETGHEVEEQLAEEPSSVEVTNVSTGEEHIELENQTAACKARTLQDEKSSDLGPERENIEEVMPLDEATDLGETLGTCKDDEKATEEENLDDNLEKQESLKEDTEIVKDQIPDMVIINDNAKVEDDSLVSPECLKEAESEEQIVAENLHVEENSTNDREAFYVTKELEETRQDEESVDPVSVHSEDREAEEKTEIIVDSSMCYYESCIEAITDVSAVASLNDNNEIVTASNIRSIETSRENIETDAKQETEVEDVQLEEMSSELDSDVQTNDNGVDAALQQEPLKEDEALVVHDIDNASSQAIQTEKPDERIQNPAVTLPSEEHRHEPVDDVDKTGEIKDGDSDGGKTVKDKTREPAAMLEGETHTSHIIAEESEEHKAVTGENKIEEAEPFEDRKIPQSEDGAAAVHTFPENETKETELTEDKSPENIQEQTREIEEASNVNETCEKAFDNELLTETADAPNEKKIVTARDETEDEESRSKKTNEGDEITVNDVSNEEVMEGKEVTETSYSTSRLEEMIEDGSGEDEQKDKLIKDNTYKENVEPESVSEVVAEERIKETLPELTNDQDDETSIDVRNQETEELIKYELKDEDSAIKEENRNEATEAAILSEKVDDSEDIKENVFEEERITNELHPVSKGDEATNEVEDYSDVSTECIKEAESMEQIEAENSEVKNTSNISSVKMSLETIESGTNQETKEVEKVQLEEISSNLAPEVPTNENDEAEVMDRDIEAFYMPKNQIAEAENGPTAELEAYDVKETEGEPETSADYTSERVETILKDDIRSTNTSPEEQLQSSTSTLLLEDEHIRIENPVEKIEEETHSDAEIKHVTQEVSSETKRIEDACFPSEELRELKAISKEETIANQGLPNDEPEEKNHTISSTLPSEENKQGSRAISEEITPEQTLEKNEPEEGTTISLLDPKEMEEENICTIEKTEEELNELDMIPDKISEHSSDAKKIAATGPEKEAIKALEDAIKDETTAAQASEAEESNERSLTPKLTVENIKHGPMANDEEDEEVKERKMREREMSLEKEGPQKLEAVVDQETIVAWASIPEESHEIEGISIVEKLDEEKRKGDENLNSDNCEGSSAGVTEELNELKLVTKEEITSSDQIFPEEQLHISTSAITSEELEYGAKETEDEKKSEREIKKDKIVKDASDASTTVETCSLKGSFVVLEVVSENEMTARMTEKTEREKIDEAKFLQDDNREDVTLQKELYQENEAPAVEEQILNPVVLPSDEQKLETINEVNKTEEYHMKEKEMENGGFDGVKPVEEISTEKDEIKEAEPVLEGETNHLHITTSALPSEIQGDETNESESKEDESPEKMRKQTGEIEEASNSKTDTCEKALDNELLAETEDGAIKENLVKENDITLNEVSTEKVMKSKEVTETSCSTTCPEKLMKDVSGEDEVKDKPIEGKIYEENVEPELAGFEEKPKSDSESVAEDQSKETIPEVAKNQDDETRTDVRNQETEEQIKEELKDKLKDEDYINREENANGVTKAVILSEKIDKEVEIADDSEDIKEHVIEKETSTNELHPVSREDETNNEIEDCSSVSTECIKESESEEQIEAENSLVEENSTNDKKVSHVTKELEEKSQAEESRDPVYVHAEHREAEEIVEITDDLKLSHDESNIEAATEVRAETSLNNAEVKKEHVNTSNISSAKMSPDTIETDANQETDKVEKVQLEEIFSDLALKISNNESDEVELIKRDPDVFYMHEDKVENGSTAELEADKVEETEGVPETSSDYISQRIETILIDDISSTNTLPEGKPDERLQSSACTLLSENEEIRIAKPDEKIEEGIRNDAKTMEEVCLPDEANLELKAVLEEKTTADKGLPNDEPDEQIQTAFSTLPSEERDLDVVQGNEVTGEQNLETSSLLVSMEDEEIVSSIGKIEEGNINEVDIQNKTSKDFSVAEKTLEICLEKEEFQELDDAKKEETASPQAIQLEKSNEQSLVLESLAENPNHGAEANEEEKKVEEVEILEKEGLKEPEAVVNQETVVSQASITEQSQKIEAIGIVEKLEDEQMKEAEKLDNGNREGSLAEETEKLNELHLVTKEEITSGQSFSEQLHISASAITSEVLEHETKDTEDEKTSEGEVIKDETKEDASYARKTVEVCSQMERPVEPETVAENKMTAGTAEKVESEKTEDAEFLNVTELQEDESHDKIQEETGEIEEASNFNMGIHEKAFDNELLNETEDAAIKENLVKARDESGCEGNQCEKTNEGNEIILSEVSKNVASCSTSHSEDPTKDGSGEDALKDELIEDNTYEELIVEAQKTSENEIIEKQMKDRVVEDQGLASVVESSTEISAAEDNEILDNIQQTKETTKTASDMQIPRGLDPIENTGITSSVAKEHVSIELQDGVAESSQKAEVGDVREIYAGVECVGEKTGEEVTEGYVLVEYSTKFSSYDPLESFTKESLQVTRGMIGREVKDETNASQIPLVEKPEKESPAPVDDVEKKELKEVETQDKGFSDTKTGGGICYEEEEKKELKAVVEQETIAIQAPQTKIKDDQVSHFEVSSKEDEHTGDKTNENLKIATCEIQNEKSFAETQKDDANNNIKTVAEDQTVKGDMNEATIVKEEIPGKEEPIESKKTTNSTGKQQLLTEQQTVVGDFEPGNAQEICSEAGAGNGEGKRPDNLGVEKSEGPEPVDTAKLSLYDLLQRSTRKTLQGTENVIEDRELIVSNEQAPEEETKTDEEEGDEHNRTESGSKPHKKSHNILSGVGSKVKQSISKVKKAITGKSSHPKEPKPISPKESKK